MATYLEILPELRDDPQDQIRLFFFNIVQTAFVFAVHMYSVTRAVLTMIKKNRRFSPEGRPLPTQNRI